MKHLNKFRETKNFCIDADHVNALSSLAGKYGPDLVAVGYETRQVGMYTVRYVTEVTVRDDLVTVSWRGEITVHETDVIIDARLGTKIDKKLSEYAARQNGLGNRISGP